MATIAKQRTAHLGLEESVQNMLAYRLTPDRIANLLLNNSVTDTNSLKSDHIVQLLQRFPLGYTFKGFKGLDIRLNRSNSNVERLQHEERKTTTPMLGWFRMRHGRHAVKGADNKPETMGTWTIEIWESGTIPNIPRVKKITK